MFFHKSQHEAKSHYHMLIFCSVIQSLHRPFTSPKKPGGWLTELGWLWTLLPSVSSSLSLCSPVLSSALSPCLNCEAALTDSTRRTGMQRGRSAAWKMASPRVLWIYPSLSLLSSLLLFHAFPPCRALRNYPENEGGFLPPTCFVEL